MKKKIISILLTVSLILPVFLGLPCTENALADAYTLPAEVSVSAKTAVLMNVETGFNVFERNINDKVYPASLTKLITALVVLDKVRELSAVVTAYDGVLSDIAGEGASNSEIQPGEQLTVEQLIYCLLVPSACDAANVLAMYVSKNIPDFVKLMNEKAKALGMASTNFTNAHGLFEANQYSTTYDLLLLAKEVIKSEFLIKVCSSARYTIPETNKHSERTLVTTNYMVDENTAWYSPSTIGIKTGNTDESGRNLITYSKKDNISYICIVTGCDNSNDNIRPDFDDTFTLLNWAFNSLQMTRLASANDTLGEVKVTLCREKDHVSAVASEDYYSIVPSNAVDSVIIKPVLNNEEIQAPVKKGDELGYAVVSCSGVELGKIKLIAAEDMDRSIILFIEYEVGQFVSSKPFMAVAIIVVTIVAVCIFLNIHHNRKRRRYYNSKSKRKQDDE